MTAEAMGQLNAIPPYARLKHGSAIVESNRILPFKRPEAKSSLRY
jgi:hypothetical protein